MCWIRLEDVLRRTVYNLIIYLEDVLKMSWRHLCKTSSTCFGHVFKTSLQDVWPRRTYSSWSRHFQDVFSRRMSKGNILILIKMSWRHLLKRNTKNVFKTSLLRQRFVGKSHGLKSGDWAPHGLSGFFGKSLYQQIYVLRVQELHLQYE